MKKETETDRMFSELGPLPDSPKLSEEFLKSPWATIYSVNPSLKLLLQHARLTRLMSMLRDIARGQ